MDQGNGACDITVMNKVIRFCVKMEDKTCCYPSQIYLIICLCPQKYGIIHARTHTDSKNSRYSDLICVLFVALPANMSHSVLAISPLFLRKKREGHRKRRDQEQNTPFPQPFTNMSEMSYISIQSIFI